MSNFSFSNTLDGLNNINANDINTDNINCDYLNVNINSSVPLVTPYTTNSNQIASCAFVQDAFANNLLGYALLNPTSPQTFTGSHNFPTQSTSNNSTLVATTAFIKNQGYALLASANTFTASNTFNNNVNFDGITSFNNVTTPIITQSIPANDATTKIPTTSWVNTYYGKKTLATANTIQTWFGNNKFTSNAANLAISLDNTDAPVYDGGLFITSIAGQANPITTVGNTVLLSNGNGLNTGILSLCVNSTTACGVRIGSSSMSIIGANTLSISGTTCNNTATNYNVSGISTFNGNVNLNNLFVSNNVQAGTGIYENQFFGDIYCYKAFTSQNGLFIQNQITPGAITYASIDPSGNLQAETIASSSTITANGNISSSGNISGATISTVGSVTANQLYIRDPANVAPSLISQTGSTLSIRAISANASPQTTLTLATRSATNVFSTILSGNTNNLNIGNDCNKIDLQSPNLDIQATSITTNATSATITGGQLNINNTLTTFNDNVVLNQSTSMNNTFTFNDGANATQFDQNGVNLTIYSTGGIKMGSGFSDNIVCTSNRAYLQGSIGNTIDINGAQATIGGSLVPKITAQPLAASNTNEIATTQWTNTKLTGYAPLGSLNNYALLTTTAQTFTGQNTFTNTAPTAPIVIKNTTSSNSGGLFITGGGNYNGINNAGDFAVIGFGPTIDNGVLNLTTWANGYCGIKIDNDTIIYNAPFTCNYNTLSTAPTKTSYDIGYVWEITSAALPNWTTFTTTPGNIATMVFNGTGNYTKGVWQVDIVLCTECLNPPNSRLIWTTVSNSSDALTKYCTYENGSTAFALQGVQIMRLSFILNVTTIPSTYYLNYVRTNGVGSSLNELKNNSHIEFTRIA